MTTLLQPLPPGEGLPAGPVGPSTPPPLWYAIESYAPYVAATVIVPLGGLLYLWVRTLLHAGRRAYMGRPDSTLYTAYMIGGVLPLIGGAFILHKIASDYVYGTMIPWRWIQTGYDLQVYLGISSFLSYFYFLAGVAVGLSGLLVVLHRYYDNWLVDVVVYLGNIAWFLYLTPIPLERFKYSSSYIAANNIPPGEHPYDLTSTLFTFMFILGLILGLALTVAASIYYLESIKSVRGSSRDDQN